MRQASKLETLLFGIGFTWLGIGLIYYMWVADGYGPFNLIDFKYFFYDNGFSIILLAFFAIIGIWILYTFFMDEVLPPKKDVLYLENKISKGPDLRLEFIGKNGKVYRFDNKGRVYEPLQYYEVLRGRFTVKEVYGVTSEYFDVKEKKKNFWFYWYSPMGNFEDVFLLPILYVVFLPGFFSFILAEGSAKIFGLIWSCYTGYYIVYDIVKKWKNW